MTKDNEEKWVDMTTKQIQIEASSGNKTADSGQTVHPPLDTVPDEDWVGGTWGLFWPDLEEFEELKEDPEKYIKKHYEDKNGEAHPLADLTAEISFTDSLTCPKEKTPPPPPPPAVVLRPKKPEVKIPESVFESTNVDNDNSKWDWMRADDKSAGKARFSLSIYW
eukprot:GFUD01008991.1.p1 GENE.GFUD01008991.1~~GFUD01008991.1.p1  ORF type:complete len:165 (+),score=41.65 GFUD01008991.1:122-616(+)